MPYSSIPEELKALNQWCISVGINKAPQTWRNNALCPASVTNTSTWLSFNDSVALAQHIAALTGEPTRIGFVLTANDPYGVIDLDNKEEIEERKSEHQEIIKRANSYTEVSLSGKGYHIFVKGNIGKGRRKDSKGVELYTRERYIICTGDVYHSTDIINGEDILNQLLAHMDSVVTHTVEDKPQVDNDEVILQRLSMGANGSKFQEHYQNNWLNHERVFKAKYKYPSASEADAALSMMIMFYSQNQQQGERIFKSSALGADVARRGKGPAYISNTIQSARNKQASIAARNEALVSAVNFEGMIANAESKLNEDINEDPWGIPIPHLRPEAFHGILKYIVEVGSENSEAVPAALGMNTLSRFAATLGREVHIAFGDDFKTLTLFSIVIGPSGFGRKGTSAKLPERIFKEVELYLQNPFPLITHRDINTGEGLIYALRDPKDKDPGIIDKRAYFEISEFSIILSRAKKEASTVTQVIRDLWDGNNLQTLTKGESSKSTCPHGVISGHITKDEFLKMATKTDFVNGFLNRFFIMHSLRTKVVHDPHPVNQEVICEIAKYISEALQLTFNRDSKSILFTEKGLKRFIELKIGLEKPRSETVKTLMVREISYLRMLAALIALINKKQEIDVPHLDAAVAWIDYWEETVEYCFTTLEQQIFHEEIVALSNDIVRLVKQLGNKNITQTQIYKAITKNGAMKNMHSLMIKAVDFLQDESPARVTIVKTRKTGARKPTILFNGR